MIADSKFKMKSVVRLRRERERENDCSYSEWGRFFGLN